MTSTCPSVNHVAHAACTLFSNPLVAVRAGKAKTSPTSHFCLYKEIPGAGLTDLTSDSGILSGTSGVQARLPIFIYHIVPSLIPAILVSV